MSQIPAFRINDDPELHVRRATTFDLNNPSSDEQEAREERRKVLEAWRSPPLLDCNIEPLSGHESMVELIRERLGSAAVETPDEEYFFPEWAFNRIFSRDTIHALVQSLVKNRTLTIPQASSSGPSETATAYWTTKIWDSNGRRFRRVLAVLLLSDCLKYSEKFIDRPLPDSALPADQKTLKDLGLTPNERTLFKAHQMRLTVPFFEPSDKSGQVCHVELHQDHVKPWMQTLDEQPGHSLPIRPAMDTSEDSTTPSGHEGGFSIVRRVIVHPWQHRFQESLREISENENIFALKELLSAQRREFDREVRNLQRFGGQKRIVTLLATAAWKKHDREHFYLFFPWANGNLLEFWRSKVALVADHDELMWTSDQFFGMVDALASIHEPNPPLLNERDQQLYGRHGDIKPENILCFLRDGKWSLVLSDLGLTAVNRAGSRSNQPGMSIPVTPGYRPPECDMDGKTGYISRSFDIWTLGCLFLEFAIWILGGEQYRANFSKERLSPYINGFSTSVWFEIMVIPGSNDPEVYAFKVKDTVTKWFADLHKHPDCSRYLHDFLDLIQDEMLILESKEPQEVKRITAADLRRRLSEMRTSCQNNRDYCLDKCPRASAHKTPHPVRARLNKKALELIRAKSLATSFGEYRGKTRPAL